MMRIIIHAGLVASLLATSALAPTALSAQRTAQATTLSAATRDSLRSVLKSMMESGNVASLSWAVTKGGKIIWEDAIGYADLERKIPATPNTRYSMASISKPIHATGMMRLVEMGKVDLDRPANDYLGTAKITGLAGDASGATIRRLLAHTAGLPLHYRFFYEGASYKRPTMDEAINRYAITVYPPGKVYNYSNLGYGVLDEVIAKVSGQTAEEFMQKEVFAPLGLASATIGTGSGLENAAVRYDANRKPIAPYDFDHRGASAVYISAHDLVRFGMFHLRDRLKDQRPILSDKLIDEMHKVQTPGDTAVGYGLGFSINYEQGYRVVSHTGGMPGVSTTLKLFPEEDVAIAVLANGSAAAPHRAIFHLAGAVLPRYNTRAQERLASGGGPSGLATPPSLWGEWNGTIRTYDGKTTPFALRIESGDVHVRLGGNDALWTVLNGPSWRNNLLGGRFMGTIPSDEAKMFPHAIGISLWLDEGKLRGWAAAQTTDEPITGAMSSYAELTKSAGPGR